MNIYLVGFMGCGKTTLGKKIAKKIDINFLDMDAEIEKQTQKSISEIFLNDGESYFRKLENDFLKKNLNQKYIISTGGGVPCFYDNMDIMNSSGLTIFIDLPAKTLLNRLENEKDKRPLIQDTPPEKLLLEIEERLNIRLPFYQKAQIIFQPLKQTDDELIEKIKLWLNKNN